MALKLVKRRISTDFISFDVTTTTLCTELFKSRLESNMNSKQSTAPGAPGGAARGAWWIRSAGVVVVGCALTAGAALGPAARQEKTSTSLATGVADTVANQVAQGIVTQAAALSTLAERGVALALDPKGDPLKDTTITSTAGLFSSVIVVGGIAPPAPPVLTEAPPDETQTPDESPTPVANESALFGADETDLVRAEPISAPTDSPIITPGEPLAFEAAPQATTAAEPDVAESDVAESDVAEPGPELAIGYRYIISESGTLVRDSVRFSTQLPATLTAIGLSTKPTPSDEAKVIRFETAALPDQALFEESQIAPLDTEQVSSIKTMTTDTDASSTETIAVAVPVPNVGWLLSLVEPSGVSAQIQRSIDQAKLTVGVYLGKASTDPLLVQRRASDPPAAADVRWASATKAIDGTSVHVLLGYDKTYRTKKLVDPLLAVTGGLLSTMLGAAWVGSRALRRQRIVFEGELQVERKLARTDALTGLGNRLACNELLDDLLRPTAGKRIQGLSPEAAGSYPATQLGVAVLLCDLDRFKVINDARGHEVGDLVLIEVAKRLREVVGELGHVLRLGGDEFVVAFPDVSPDQAVDTAEAVVATLREPFAVGSDSAVLGVSVGLVMAASEPNMTRSLMLRDADMAMYVAKREGGNRVAVAGEDVRRNGSSQLNLEIALRSALGNGQLKAWYQPIVDTNREIVALEALVRWEHPDRGLLPPGAFLPAAKDAGLLGEISTVVLAQACHEVARWNNIRRAEGSPPLTVHVNCVEEQLMDSGFADVVGAYIRSSGIDPQHLMLEISEETAVDKLPASLPTVELLRSVGVRFSLDDFGFGNSSLTMVRRLGEISELKLDKSIVDGLAPGAGSGEADIAIIRAITEFAETQKISLVAEGIEQEEQWETLKGLGVELFQGYLFYRPQPVAALESLLVRTELLLPAAG
jgi:diguanylate cyclase (GGDEF)-like protein